MKLRILAALGVAVVTTICAPVRADAPKAAPAKADPAAYALLKTAHDARQVLPHGFVGFDADIALRVGEKSYAATLKFRLGQKSTLHYTGISKDDQAWLQDQVFSMLAHRGGGDFAHGDGAYALAFGAAPDNEFGKLIELNDGMDSSYRVRGDKIAEVTRSAGDTRFTITVIETMPADPGKNLPVHFMVAYRNIKTGALEGVEGYRDAYQKIGGAWLPASRTVIAFGAETSPQIRSIRFKNITIVK